MILLYATVDWALIGLFSVAGSTLIVQSLNIASQAKFILFAALIVAGVVFQVMMLRSHRLATR